MANKTTSQDLAAVFETHPDETEVQVGRSEQVSEASERERAARIPGIEALSNRSKVCGVSPPLSLRFAHGPNDRKSDEAQRIRTG